MERYGTLFVHRRKIYQDEKNEDMGDLLYIILEHQPTRTTR